MLKHVFYLGLNDKDSKVQEVNTLDAYKIANNIIKKYYTGATIRESLGMFTHADGVTVTERSLEIVIIDADLKKSMLLINDLKQAFNQESVMFESSTVNIKFI